MVYMDASDSKLQHHVLARGTCLWVDFVGKSFSVAMILRRVVTSSDDISKEDRFVQRDEREQLKLIRKCVQERKCSSQHRGKDQ